MDDEILTQIFKIKLMSPPCQNQGYVLDGYPKTLEQAQSLFGGKLEKKNSIFILHSYFFLASGEEGKT